MFNKSYVLQIAADVRNVVGNSAVNTPDKDAVKAELSWFNAGAESAESFAKADDGKAKGLPILRETVLSVLESPPASWDSFKEGFKSVQVAREKANKSVDTIKVVRSQIARIFAAAKTQHSKVIQVLKDKEHFAGWKAVIKNMPKQGNAGAKSKADVEPGHDINVDTETNIGTLIQVATKALERLEEISKPMHNHPYGAFIAREALGAMIAASALYQETMLKHELATKPGNLLAFLTELELVEEGKEPEHLLPVTPKADVEVFTSTDGSIETLPVEPEQVAEVTAEIGVDDEESRSDEEIRVAA